MKKLPILILLITLYSQGITASTHSLKPERKKKPEMTRHVPIQGPINTLCDHLSIKKSEKNVSLILKEDKEEESFIPISLEAKYDSALAPPLTINHDLKHYKM